MRLPNVVWAITRKDILIWLRQPTAIAATVMPSIALFVVLYFSSSAVGRNPVALVVLDNGPHAQALAKIIEDSDAFIAQRVAPDEASALLRDVSVAAVITIPSGFDAAYNARQPDPVSIEINNLNLDFTNDLRRSLPAAITEFYGQQSDSPIDVRISESDLRRQDINLGQFELIPTLVLLITIAGVVNAALATAREWEEKTLTEILLAPISRLSIILGKLLAGWLTTLFVAGIVVIIGAASGYLRPSGPAWIPTIGVIALLALASAGLGVALGAALGSIQRVTGVAINVSFYLFFLSGGITVAAFLPAWVQTIAHFIPTFYGVHALEMSVFYGSTEDLGRDLAVVAGTAVVTIAFGVVSLRRKTAS